MTYDPQSRHLRYIQKRDKVLSYQKGHYQRNHLKRVEYQRQYRQKSNKPKEYRLKYYKQNVEKIKAEERRKYQQNPRIKLSQNMARHEFPNILKCDACGSTQVLERHHPDYNQPLKILILCRSCHQKVHEGTLNHELLVGLELEEAKA